LQCDGKLGLYQEKANSPDELTIISNQQKQGSDISEPNSSTLPRTPKAPQKPKAPTPIGKKPEGDYVSRTFRKDEKSGQRS